MHQCVIRQCWRYHYLHIWHSGVQHQNKGRIGHGINNLTDAMSSKHIPLVRWIWRSYFRTSLIPLLIVEVALISLYFISNAIANRENIQAIRSVAEQDVREVAMREAAGINRQLEGVAKATEYLRYHTTQVMAGNKQFERDDPSRFQYSNDGVFYTTRDNDGTAVFYSGIVPIGENEREKAYRSAGLDQALACRFQMKSFT